MRFQLCSVMALAAVLNFSTPTIDAQTTGHQFFQELTVITGRTPKAASGQKPIFGLGYGVGAGKNFVSLEITNQNLGAYAVGYGKDLFPDMDTPLDRGIITNSGITDLTGDYQRTILPFGSSGSGLYLVGGGGLTWSRFTSSTACISLFCMFPNYGTPVSTDNSAHGLTLALGAGIKTPAYKGLGLRYEVRYSTLLISQSVPYYNKYQLPSDNANLLRFTIALYYRNKDLGWLSR